MKVKDIDHATALIGGVFFGGLEPHGAQWEKCRKAADLILTQNAVSEPRKVGHPGKADGALKLAKEFTRAFPIGTEGFCPDLDGRKTLVRVETEGMVYPDPFKSETVMAWFHPVGWRPVGEFEPRNKNPNQDAAELCAAAMQQKANRRFKMAECLYYAALKADPTYWRAMNDIGVLCHEGGRHDEAVCHITAAIAYEEHAYELYNNRSLALRARGDYEKALADCEESIRLAPAVELMVLNRASLLDDLDRSGEAIAYLNEYVSRRPDKTNVAHNRSIMLLSNGMFTEGWPAYDARLHVPSANVHYEHYGIPRWQPGDDVNAREVLVWTEQGLGDELLTASMVPDLIARGARVTILCSEKIQPLLARSFKGMARVEKRPSLLHLDMFKRQPLTPEMQPAVVTEIKFDYQMSQGDLGRMLRPDFTSFSGAPFLKPEKTEVNFCNNVYFTPSFGSAPTPLIGISWHSQKNPNVGHLKSIDLAQWGPILKTPGVRFVNLQYGDCKADIQRVKEAFGVEIIEAMIDPLATIDDFAAMVSCMDLVITVSNTTAHVAGGLGVPTWIMVPHGPAKLWYWSAHTGATCPWYNSALFYRQTRSSQWGQVIDAVAKDLPAWLQAHSGPAIISELGV